MRVTELADACRRRGLTVVEVAGWQTRGNEFPVRPDGALRHWTAGPATGDTPSLGVVTHGRSDLAGPLCNLYQSRRVDANGLDVIYVVAAGKANHAGEGEWNGIRGNYKLLGLEIEWAGPTEAFAGVRRRKLTSELAMRALLDCSSGTNTDDVAEHQEYALPRGRKIDTNLDGGELRRRMAELAAGTPAEVSTLEEDMPAVIIWFQSPVGAAAYKVHGADAVWVPSPADLEKEINFWRTPVFNTAGTAAPARGVSFIDGPNQTVLTRSDLAALPKAVVEALPPASSGGLSKDDVADAVRVALAPIFDAL